MHADWLKIVFLHRNTELARAVDAMMARANRIYILMIKVKLFPLFSSRCFLKEIRNVVRPCFYQVIEALMKVWENSKNLWKHLPRATVPTAYLILRNFHPCFFNLIETQYMFSIKKNNNNKKEVWKQKNVHNSMNVFAGVESIWVSLPKNK